MAILLRMQRASLEWHLHLLKGLMGERPLQPHIHPYRPLLRAMSTISPRLVVTNTDDTLVPNTPRRGELVVLTMPMPSYVLIKTAKFLSCLHSFLPSITTLRLTSLCGHSFGRSNS